MAFQDSGGGFGGQRQMFDVSAMGLTCANCGTSIKELPFEPKADRPVYCRDCNRNRTGQRQGQDRGGFRSSAPRQMFDVTSMGLKCANCQTNITELPFEPKSDQPVYCRNCNRERKQNFSGGSRY
ncbi:MAG TPA: CxxC-x17-CxxC domain-containing protein [Patescibacteria group bacterium]|nr:CxxC-x17-CxxC domain-containing protein [Patescibacteria group bacterium]